MSDFLAVDTSSRYLTVAAKKGDKLIIRHLNDCAMQHSVILMDEIGKALDQAGLTCAECDFFGAVTGPGSFTGIRIGISAIKGLAVGAGKPVRGITSFELLAYNVKSDDFCVVIDAAHSHFYVQRFGKNAFAPAYLSLAETEKLSCPLYGFENLSLPGYTALNVADCLYPAILKGELCDPAGLKAQYVRKSQAEEGRK